MDSCDDRLQIFVQYPELNPRSRALALSVSPTHTVRELKRSLFPHDLPSQALASLYLTFQGKPLRDDSTILRSGVAPSSTITLRIRAPGGGGDGGATGAESRDCYLNMYATKKPDKVDPNEKRLSKWTNCALSFEPLKHPCVLDRLGNVFNKESLVRGLLAKNLPKEFVHIKGLRDMIPIQLSVIPGMESNDWDGSGTRFQCPISGLEFNGKYKFFALRVCGHVLSAKALKEIRSSACHVCHMGFTEEDKIVINGTEEEVAVLREKIEEEKSRALDKKAKKLRNGGVEIIGNDIINSCISQLSGAKHGIDNKSLEKVTGKVEVCRKTENGGAYAKGASNGSVKRFKASDMAPAHATKEVYASIFTSSRKSDFKETYSCRSLPLGRN